MKFSLVIYANICAVSCWNLRNTNEFFLSFELSCNNKILLINLFLDQTVKLVEHLRGVFLKKKEWKKSSLLVSM